MSQAQGTLVLAIDLGTSATTAQFGVALDSFDDQGNLHRTKIGRITEMRAWPGGQKNDAIGNTCLPTDLVYERASGRLLFWGFQAQQYLDDPSPEVPRERVFIVAHIKLLLNDPNDGRPPTDAGRRYQIKRDELLRTLRKSPFDVFEDFLTKVADSIVDHAKLRAKGMVQPNTYKLELALAFPSGWPEYIHRRVAAIGARAIEKALVKHDLSGMVFGIENVYTVSETLCGVKEWLFASIEDASISIDIEPQTSNLDELQGRDCFLAEDIGGGTGCITALRLVSKSPLQVDQLGPTQSLEVSGEAVEAEFEKRLRSIISAKDLKGDLNQLIYKICREFKEEKKNCGQPPRPGSSTWNIPAPGLRANGRKGFEKDCMKIKREMLAQSFDPVLDKLEAATEQFLKAIPGIKAIVFLGQFGGSSDYLRNRMTKSPIGRSVKLRHSQSGKLDVVKGAMSERLALQEKFVRKSETLKSYGTLISLDYYPGSEGYTMFPNAIRDGAVPFKGKQELALECPRVKVVEWAVSKRTILHENLVDIGQDGRRHHTWRFSEEDIGFDDIIVISDEDLPPPGPDGKSYTLWTRAHEQNQLIVDGRRLQVEQVNFGWDLVMSQKLDPEGKVIGSYGLDEVEIFMWPEEKKRNKRRAKLRRLDYDLVWEISEMQVKIHIRAIFPNPTGPLVAQLAKEQPLRNYELTAGESRSHALEEDIRISADAAALRQPAERHQNLDDIFGPDGSQLINDLASEHYQQLRPDVSQMTGPLRTPHPVAQMTDTSPLPQTALMPDRIGIPGSSRGDAQFGSHIISSVPVIPSNGHRLAEVSSDNMKFDGRRREGCYTCKKRKKKCDCSYTFNEKTGVQSCNTCIRYSIACYMTEPEWVNDPEQVKAKDDERKRLVKLKRKSREESASSGRTSRDRSATIRPAEFSSHQSSVLRSIENVVPDQYRVL